MGGTFGNRAGRGGATSARASVKDDARYRTVLALGAEFSRLAIDPHVLAGDVLEACRRVTEGAARLCGVGRVSVWLLDEDRRQLVLQNLFELGSERHSSGTVLQASDYPSYFGALVSGSLIDAHDARTDPRTAEFREGYLEPLGIQSMLDAAVRSAGRVVGVICFEHVGEEPLPWEPEVVSFAGQLADVISRTLLNQARQTAEREVRALNHELEGRVRERTAALEAANRELEAFSYSVSHDLRAPLRHVSGFAGILKADYGAVLDDDGRAYLDKIDESVRRMEALVEGLLALARLGQRAVRIAPADSQTIVRSVWAELERTYDLSRYRLELGDLPPCSADAILLRQVWANLLDNAAKYSANAESPVVTVDSFERESVNWFRVRDNGVGFDNAHADEVFGVFSRLHKQTEFGGVGVGLALTKRIVEKHGGEIHARCEDGGATFEFSLGAA